MSTKCITPFYIKHKISNEKIPVPCSKCPPCMKRRTSGWSYRLVKEGDRSKTALFITLTYNTDKVPITKKGYMNLDKKDVQKFMKRLRKLSNEKLILCLRRIRYAKNASTLSYYYVQCQCRNG